MHLNDDLQVSVYMSQLEGYNDPMFPNYVFKLNMAPYGLKKAPRAWFDKLKKSLV